MPPDSDVVYEWHGEFDNAEVNRLHAEGFQHRLLDIDWRTQLEDGPANDAARSAESEAPPPLRAWDGLSDEDLLAEMVRARGAHLSVDRAVRCHVTALRECGVSWARIGESLEKRASRLGSDSPTRSNRPASLCRCPGRLLAEQGARPGGPSAARTARRGTGAVGGVVAGSPVEVDGHHPHVAAPRPRSLRTSGRLVPSDRKPILLRAAVFIATGRGAGARMAQDAVGPALPRCQNRSRRTSTSARWPIASRLM